MTTKEWLNRGYKIDVEIDALIAEQRAALQRATGAAAAENSDKVQTSKQNTTENKFISYAAYSERIDKRIDALYAVKNEIIDVINLVENNTLRQLLILRYIKFYTWDRIAEELHYSREWVTKALHPQALKAVKF